MRRYRPPSYDQMPLIVKNLLIINGLFYLASWVFLNQLNYDLSNALGLFNIYSDDFRLYQLVTHMFMHSTDDMTHILFNMFGLWFFGHWLEAFWGPKKFLTYYMLTGFGAALLQMGVNAWDMYSLKQLVASGEANAFEMDYWQLLLRTRMVGASGAVFGLLMAMGVLFPNREIMLLFVPVPIKVKYIVIGYGLFEFYYGIERVPGDNVARFAHLGGMIFGYILIKYWNKTDRNSFY